MHCTHVAARCRAVQNPYRYYVSAPVRVGFDPRPFSISLLFLLSSKGQALAGGSRPNLSDSCHYIGMGETANGRGSRPRRTGADISHATIDWSLNPRRDTFIASLGFSSGNSTAAAAYGGFVLIFHCDRLRRSSCRKAAQSRRLFASLAQAFKNAVQRRNGEHIFLIADFPRQLIVFVVFLFQAESH